MKNKNNARTGGAVLSPPNKGLEFINTGHAAQSRYLAALANPFASPAVPIPDSFLMAHVSKVCKETVLTNVSHLKLDFYKAIDGPTGDYHLKFSYYDSSGWQTAKHEGCNVGTRLVAAGVSFEDIGKRDDLEGIVTYSQLNGAYDGTVAETVSMDQRSSRNTGFGTVLYELQRRQALDFEGDSRTSIEIEFSTPVSVLARYCGIIEYDGKIGIPEVEISNKEFITSSSYPNHHAGIFADTPHPDLDHSLIEPSHTDVQKHNPGHHSTALTAAAQWVSSAAGWLWKHRGEAANLIKKAPSFYQSMGRFGGSIMGTSGQIMALGARAAPLAIAL